MDMKRSIVVLCFLIGSCGYKSEDVPAGERDGGIGEAEGHSRDFSLFKPDQSPWYYSEWAERTSDVGKLSFFLQDKQGYFWGVNEKDHLIRYNGYDIKDFHNGKLIEDENSFNCTSVVTIFEDSRGYIWLESGCGLYRYDPELERFTNLSVAVTNDTGVTPRLYHSIIEDQDGLIWIGTQAGVFYYDYATDRFSFVRGGLFHALLLFEDEKGAIWNGSSVYEMRLSSISKDSFKVNERLTVPKRLNKYTLAGFRVDYARRLPSSKEIYFAVLTGQPVLFDPGAKQIIDLDKILEDGEIITAPCKGKSAEIILGTSRGRIITYDSATNSFRPLVHASIGKEIESLLIDQNSNLWVQTNDPFPQLYQVKPSSTGMSSSLFPRAHQRPNGNPDYLANIGGEVYFVYPDQLIPVKEAGEAIDLNFSFPEDVYLYKFITTPENELWLAAYGFAPTKTYYLKLDRDFNILYKRECLHHIEKDCFGDHLQGLTLDDDNNLWVSGWAGIISLNPDTDSMQVFSAKVYSTDTINLLKDQRTFSIQYAADHIWVGHYSKGISKYSLSTKTFNHYDSLVVGGVPLYERIVTDIYKDKNDDVWIATDKGFFRYMSELDSFKVYSMVDGLGENEITNILEDQHGQLWVVTWSTINKFDREKERFYAFDINLLSNWGIKNSSIIRDREGILYLSKTDAGIIRINPDQLQINRKAPPLLLEAFLLSNVPVFVSDQTGVLDKHFNLTDDITLTYDQNIFTIRYAAREFDQQDKINFAFQLEGFDRDWQYVEKKREATYTNLPPKAYTFKVKCQNEHGFWGEPRSLSITVLPPWHRTWLAYFLWVAIVLGSIYWLYRFQLTRRLAQAETRRLKELDVVKTRLYTNITHEFRTPLTIINSTANSLLAQADYAMRENLKRIQRSGRQLLNLVDQMLDLAKLESGKLTVNWIQGNVIVFLKYLLESFHSLAEAKNISLHFQSGEESLLMDFDAEKLQQIVSNLLSNAIKFTAEGGHVRLAVTVENSAPNSTGFGMAGRRPSAVKAVLLTVTDNGRGIPPQQLDKIFERFYQVDDSATRHGEGTGIGLTLTRELVKLLEGKITVESELDRGTTFSVLLPIRNTAPMAESLPDVDPAGITGARNWETAASVSAHHSLGDGGPTLLIIEDNPDVVYYLSTLLRRDYHLLIAPNGKKGLELAWQELPQLILCDVMMPEMDGYEVTRRLKEDLATSHIPIILLTARADFDSRMEGLELGADAYLTKPFEERELKVRLKKLLENRKRLREFYTSGAFFSQGAAPSSAQGPKDREFFQQLLSTIKAHLDDPSFKAEMLCQALYMSYATCLRKVKAVTGMTINEYIRQIRIHRAAERLLESPGQAIVSIAGEVGFVSGAHFSREFAKVMGCSPREYRRRGRG